MHQRASMLLELLKKAQSRQSIYERDLWEWRAAGRFDNIRLFRHENDILIDIATMNDVQKRILKSYYWVVIELYHLTEDFMLPVNITF